MKKYITLDSNTSLRLALMVPAIALMGITGCSTDDPIVKSNDTGAYLSIAKRGYNTESRGFDRPWPFGPESSEQ
jgi:hypothetical protein